MTTTNQELKALFDLLERAGMNPQLCDTPVPYFENGVKAGIPADVGDVVKGDYVVLPRELLGWQPVFVISVKGDSMCDAGILPGDRLQVQLEATVDDGDIVVASIDGECTVKAFCTDDRGCRWLVPRNDKYKAIRLTEDMNVRIVGKVVGHIKDAPRTSFSDCMKIIRQTREGSKEATAISRQHMEETVRAVAGMVGYGRQWYAVYRAMVDAKAVDDGDYAGFVDLLNETVPEHGHLPRVIELRRMAVQSFRKPVVLWERGDAPVAGQRYDDYLRIARLVSGMLKTP